MMWPQRELWTEICKDHSAEWFHWREHPREPNTDHRTNRMDANTEKQEQRQTTKEMLPKYQRIQYNNTL